MGFSSGFLHSRIKILNRKKAVTSPYGIDGDGIEWEETGCVWANVGYQKGKAALAVGALDAYAVVIVRTRWTEEITMRSRILHEGVTYQILPETFHAEKRENTLQFMAQAIINDN